MTMITRWEPFRRARRMHDLLDRMMDDAWMDFVPVSGQVRGNFPIDLYQTDEAVVVKATLPGVKSDDLSVSIRGESLTIEGEIKEEHEESSGNGVNYYVRERRFGTFSRSLTLPTLVDTDKAEADFEDGVLTLTLPKVEEVKPKTITVKAK